MATSDDALNRLIQQGWNIFSAPYTFFAHMISSSAEEARWPRTRDASSSDLATATQLAAGLPVMGIAFSLAPIYLLPLVVQ